MGRKSKLPKISLKKVETLAGLGLVQEEIANVIGISHTTLETYKTKHPKFLVALKRGKDLADSKVVASLYKRAIGFTYREEHYESIMLGEGENAQPAIKKKTIVKLIAPDTVACIYWLNNRRKADWRNKVVEVGDKKYEDEMIEIIPANNGNGKNIPNRVSKFLQ